MVELSKENTDFVTFYVGVAESELRELDALIQSFLDHYDHQLIVMDMSKAAIAAAGRGERLWQQPRAYSDGLKPNCTPEQTDQLFEKYPKDRIKRVEAEFYQPRSYRTNLTIYEVLTKPFALLLDSDIEFVNDRFFTGASRMLKNMSDDEFGAMSNIISPLPFGVDKGIFGSRRTDLTSQMLRLTEKLTKWLVQRRLKASKHVANHDPEGVRRKGMIPRFDPAFLLINRKRMVEEKITFQIKYIDIDDYTETSRQEWRILGDEGAILYDFADRGMRIVNVDYERWAHHKNGSWQHIQSKNVNWYYIGRGYEGTDRAHWKKTPYPPEYVYDPSGK